MDKDGCPVCDSKGILSENMLMIYFNIKWLQKAYTISLICDFINSVQFVDTHNYTCNTYTVTCNYIFRLHLDLNHDWYNTIWDNSWLCNKQMRAILKKKTVLYIKAYIFRFFSEIMFDPLSANPYTLSYLKLRTECVRKKHLNTINLVAK